MQITYNGKTYKATSEINGKTIDVRLKYFLENGYMELVEENKPLIENALPLFDRTNENKGYKMKILETKPCKHQVTFLSNGKFTCGLCDKVFEGVEEKIEETSQTWREELLKTYKKFSRDISWKDYALIEDFIETQISLAREEMKNNMIEYIDKELKLVGYEHKEILQFISSL